MNTNRNKMLLGIGVCIGIIGMLSVSYALWFAAKEQTGMNQIKSSCFNISLENEKNEINLQNSFPILNEEGKKLVPYSFTITNTCDIFASYTITLDLLEDSTTPTKYIASMVNNEAIEILGNREESALESGVKERRVLAKGSLGSGDSDDYNLRLWVDEGVTLANKDIMNTTLHSRIHVVGVPSTYNPIDAGITTLHDAILANEYQTTPEIAKEKIHNKQTPDFSKTAPLINWQESHETRLTTATTNVEGYIGTSYEFNTETGYYTLKDYGAIEDYKWYTDISSEEYKSHNYYTCVGAKTLNGDGTVVTSRPRNCTALRKIVSAEEYEENGEKKNRITSYLYTQSELESDKSDKGLYEAVDDYGTSYYYRGSVKNNNVYFGGFYWQIIRVNGDGSIRMMYNGTTPNASGSSQGIGSTQFNEVSNNPVYVGYMYGNNIGLSYEENIKNEVDSLIKTKIDSWYKTNVEDKNLSQYLVDAGFCNDRSLYNGDGVSTDKATIYMANLRVSGKAPSFLCSNQENDLFTTNQASIGNQALTYPVGLPTIDEILSAGMVSGAINRISYIRSNNQYWTMSPIIFQMDFCRMFTEGVNGYPVYSDVLNSTTMIRPVINLASDVEISGGIGSSSDPFVVKTT